MTLSPRGATASILTIYQIRIAINEERPSFRTAVPFNPKPNL
jgi:hypothetical protein